SEGQLWVAYEPIVPADTAQVIGFEALLRWNHPERGSIPPSEFIPVAEDTGLIVPIGNWVLGTAARQLRMWRGALPAARDLTVSVNPSKRQVIEQDLIPTLRRVLKENRLPGSALNLEITESTVMERMDLVGKVLHEARTLGVGLHMDDFGTGLS